MQGSDNTSSASSPHCRNPVPVPTSLQPSPLTLLQQQTASTQSPPAAATSSSSSALSPLAAYAASLSQGKPTPPLKPHTLTAPSIPKASPLLAYASSLAHQQKATAVGSAGGPPSSTLVSTGEQSMGTLASLVKPHTDNSEEDYDV